MLAGPLLSSALLSLGMPSQKSSTEEEDYCDQTERTRQKSASLLSRCRAIFVANTVGRRRTWGRFSASTSLRVDAARSLTLTGP
jgi:hypothetical protein